MFTLPSTLFPFLTMSFLDILHLALRNLRQAKLRATLTTMGVIVGVAVIVTMVSFGLGLQRNMLSRFKALDLFNEIQVFGRSLEQSGFDKDRKQLREMRMIVATAVRASDRSGANAKTRRRRHRGDCKDSGRRLRRTQPDGRLLTCAQTVIRRLSRSAALRCQTPVRVSRNLSPGK